MVKLWAAAVEQAGSIQTDRVREGLIGLRFDAPQGTSGVPKRTSDPLIGKSRPMDNFGLTVMLYRSSLNPGVRRYKYSIAKL